MDNSVKNTPNKSVECEENVDVQVIFKNTVLMREYKSKVEKFFNLLLKNEKTFVVNSKFSMDEDEQVAYSHNPFPNSSSPYIYNSPFSKPIESVTKEPKNDENKDLKVSELNCFNCLGDHYLRDCPEDYDIYRITTNKREFYGSARNVACRYHTNENLTTQNKSRPGLISDELRYALGVSHRQLPPYIYTMRLLGYPPGWLEEAKVRNSGMTIFTSSSEDGAKLNETHQSESVQYDGNKFIKYPGFNWPMPHNVQEESQIYGMPPMQKSQMLSEALKNKHVTTTATDVYKKRKQSFSPKKKVKRLKTDYSSGECTSSSDDSECENNCSHPSIKSTETADDKSIENLQKKECLNSEENVNVTEKYQKCERLSHKRDYSSGECTSSDSESTNSYPKFSPTETKKHNAKCDKTVQCAKTNLNSKTVMDNVEKFAKSLNSTLSNDKTSEIMGTNLKSTAQISKNEGDFKNENLKHKSSRNLSTHVYLGVPLIETPNSHRCIPSSKKFAMGIHAHENFQNLPNTLGNYKKLRSILKNLKENVSDKSS